MWGGELVERGKEVVPRLNHLRFEGDSRPPQFALCEVGVTRDVFENKYSQCLLIRHCPEVSLCSAYSGVMFTSSQYNPSCSAQSTNLSKSTGF